MIPTAMPTAEPIPNGLFGSYRLGAAYDEMFEGMLRPRPHYQALFRRLAGLSPQEFRRRKAMTDLSMLQDGVGFTVYRQEEGTELQTAATHVLGYLYRAAHAQYNPDSHAQNETVRKYREKHPAADKASQAVTIYPLSRPAAK